MTYSYGFYFSQPWWLVSCILLVPIIWLAKHNLTGLGKFRRILATILRCLVIIILISLLARPILTRKSQLVTTIAVIDRSQSIPSELQQVSLDYLAVALSNKIPQDQVAVVDVAEAASISQLPSGETDIRQRNTTLRGQQSRLADGIEMAMAIAPPDTAVRILLVSEGNETSGDLKEAARTATANGIPIDVLPIRYQYNNEVVFKSLVAPTRARSSQTVSLRFILNSTGNVKGKLQLNLNDEIIDLDPDTPEVTVPIELDTGTNVKTVSLPLGTRGIHKFEAIFIPDNPELDRISQNNRSSAITNVTGPGRVMVVDADGSESQAIRNALSVSDINVDYVPISEFPDNLAMLLDTDAVILVNTDCSSFTYQQQEMVCSYVNDLGGGLVMVGGPESYGAGGWIGSPVAEILPVDLDPPQKKELPKGALVLIMHACEMPQGNYWGKVVASAAVKTLSRLDLVGILAYNWQGTNNWGFPLSQVGDKEAVLSAINQMVMGDMPSLQDHLLLAYEELIDCDAAQKHVIVISDGDPQAPTTQLLNQCRQAGITCTGVGIFPHSPKDVQSLIRVAQLTGGSFYDVKDPSQLPQIFIKEAQIVRRALIVEETFSPQTTYSLSEITKGLPTTMPNLDGYILTGPKGGLNQVILSSHQADPILAICQSGLGRCAAFTSSSDARWASSWLQWSGFAQFWEQTVRWAAKPAHSTEVEVFTDVQGDQVSINVEAVDSEGKFIQFANIDGQIISPDISTEALELTQTGPGQYSGQFQTGSSGSYIVNLRYRKYGEEAEIGMAEAAVNIPFASEFRDLSDNAPLLSQISEITGGQILSSDPNQVNLFDHAGLNFPETQMPLVRPLMFIWLALFLLDVATRKVLLDIRAIVRRISRIFRSKSKDKSDFTLEQLKQKRKKVQDQFSIKKRIHSATKRYQADDKFEGDLPTVEVKTTQKEPAETPKKDEKSKKVDKSAEESESSHIQRLLKAKRKSGDKNIKMREDTDA